MKELFWWIKPKCSRKFMRPQPVYYQTTNSIIRQTLINPLQRSKKKASLCQRLTPHCGWVTGRIIRNMEPQKWKQCKGQSHQRRREQDWCWRNLILTVWCSLHTKHYSCLFHNTFCLGLEGTILTDHWPTATKTPKSLVSFVLGLPMVKIQLGQIINVAFSDKFRHKVWLYLSTIASA